MSIVTANLAVSLDGIAAGPRQSLDHPFGTGADALTAWMFETDQPGREADRDLLATLHAGTGAHVMGRNMFGPGRGAWDETWTGWWGPEPPYHAPVFVLTHHERAPLEMRGGTTFTFVTEGIGPALELVLHLVPVVLGAGERLLDGVSGITLEPTEVIASPAVTHLRYKVRR
jgi:dihydrofolate reductase